MLEELDLAQSSLGEDLLAEDIGDFLDRDTLTGLTVRGSTGRAVSARSGSCLPTKTHQTIPYAP